MRKTLSGLVLCLALTGYSVTAGPRDEQWKKVDDAVSKGLPKTAIEQLDPIITGALADKAYAEAIKAIGKKIALEGNIQGNKPEEKIFRLQTDIEKYPAEMKPVLEALLAHWYWQYFQHNRWRFLQRTQTAAAPGPDLQTWDLPRILAEIDKHFTAALANERVLKATPVSAYSDLLVKGSAPDSYRPTMFDFLAHEALQFYQVGEHGAVKAEDEFVLDVTSPIFADAAEFMQWLGHPAQESAAFTGETPVPLKAIHLYQNLLKFHQNDADRSAFLDADLARLVFGHNKAVGETKSARYVAALKRFVDECGKHELAAQALHHWASEIREDDPVEARRLAQRGLDAFPKSAGGDMCFNLIQQIEAKSASIQTERVWNEPWPGINVTYRNITKVYFRAVPYEFEPYLKTQRWGLYNFDDKGRKELLSRKPVLEWNADLPATKDYRERSETLPAPKNLQPGFYFILASHDPAFGERNSPVSVAPVWISDLALVMRQRPYDSAEDGFVLKAKSGAPVEAATVQVWSREREGWFKLGESIKTDANGYFRLTHVDERQDLYVVTAGDQQIATGNEYWFNRNPAENKGNRTVIFTDRALYRPGQTIYFKGIRISYDQTTNKYEVMAGRGMLVEFLDPNGKQIATAGFRLNDYGSFDGTFVVPRDRGTGRMELRGMNGSAWFNVEEYKRPKFQVELPAPKEAAKLNADVALTGKATAYTGAAIGGAKVKWRVVREVRFPYWCWWSWWYRPSASQAIAHGSAVTAADGTFPVLFNAKPDPSIPEKDEPTFEFHVYADVTDTTGETRSADRLVRAGYTALQVTLAADEWQTPTQPVEVKVETKSLDGEPQFAAGTVKIYALKQPAQVVRAQWHGHPARGFGKHTGKMPVPPDPTDPNSWELGELVEKQAFKTDAKGLGKFSVALKAGIYRAMLDTQDRFGKLVTARLQLQVVNPRERHYTVKLPNHFAAPKWSLEPGESFTALWATGYEQGRAFVEIEHRGKLLKSYWTASNRTQETIEQPVADDMRGGFTVRVTYVRENRAYLNERIVAVPWSDKKLTLKWEHFTSKLGPGQKETWTAVITKGLEGEPPGEPKPISKTARREARPPERAAAEMVAALYDASLDQYLPHDWPRGFSVFRREVDRVRAQFENNAQSFQHVAGWWRTESRGVDWRYRSFPPELVQNLWGYGYFRGANRMMAKGQMMEAANGAMAMDAAPRVALAAAPAMMQEKQAAGESDKQREALRAAKTIELGVTPVPDLSKVAARKNLNETAFFFPHLLAGEDGVVKMEFTMPEALTEWKFLGFAHDKQLRAGYLTDKTVTAKDLMVEPNPPRFVREGDVIEFTVKVSNQSADRVTGKVRLTLADARTLQSMDAALGNAAPEVAFDVPGKESRSYAWRLTVPDGCEFLTYKAVGATATLSDGEEGYLPVLSRRILVTESLPLPVRGKQTKKFAFAKLLESGKSDTLRQQALTVQMVSQPAWYAVMALPYLMEYPYECSEQVFNRLYANALARHIANSDPKIRRIFDLWKNGVAAAVPGGTGKGASGTDATTLDSPLEKNQDLKSVMLEETPWVRQATAESQARRNVGLLFDGNRLDEETARTLRKLAEMQLSEGLWPWFPGGRPSEYISLYITTGFGRLRHLGVAIDIAPAVKSLNALDGWMDNHYRHIVDRDRYVPSSTDALYLYGRSFFLKDRPIAKQHREAVDYFLQQSRKFWLKVNCRQSQAHLAIALQRFGDKETPQGIMKSIKERSVSNEEMGMFWRELELSWWWYRAPIETQALMIEAFAEVMNDAQAVEDCKVWLLKQKQTQDWKTTKATADAIYALLLQRGDGVMEQWSTGKPNTPIRLLASDALVEVALAGEWIKPEKVEAGTGFYEQKFVRNEIKPALGKITVKKVDEGVSWGSVHWQYLEDMTKVTPHEGTPLKLKKTLWVKEASKKGQELKPVTGVLAVGDELVVRVELRTDRDMEYVHLKDQRGSGTEPVNVLSRYKYQDGLAYYESTRDTASHFFIDYLPKGVYVFEYSTRVQLKGRYQTGIAEIQCMYAPEFNSHSESFTLEVR